MSNISVDTSDFDRFERDLGSFAKRAVPFAIRTTLNNAAFTTAKVAKAHVMADMINRNTWTIRSIRIEKARGTQVHNMQAVVGSTEQYMADQEFGTTKKAKGKHGTPITMSYASGEGEGTQPRRKLATKWNKIRNIQLMKTKKTGKNRKQQNIISIAEAAKAGRRYVFLDLGKTKGIARLKGSLAKGPKSKGGKYTPEIKWVQDLSNRSVLIPKNPWLKPSVDKVRPAMKLMYFKALQHQVKRQRLFLEKRGL